MRIAQISPLIESVPPKLYGGTERIVSILTEELVRQGHEVVRFASADLETAAELVPCSPKALRTAHAHDAQAYNVLQLEKICQRAGDFDVLHFHTHTDDLHLPLVRSLDLPAVTTMHGRLDLPGNWMIVEPAASNRLEDNLNPVGRMYYEGSTMNCIPTSLAQPVGTAFGAQAGFAKLSSGHCGGFAKVRRAADTSFNMIREA